MELNYKKIVGWIKWFFKSGVFIAPLIIIIDQITKFIIKTNKTSIVVIKDFFYINYSVNTGVAGGLFSGMIWVWAIFSLVAGIAMIIFLYKKYRTFDIYNRIAMLFIIGGCFGNMIDRMFFEGVTDFLEFHFGSYIFPNFNVADSALVLGVIGFAITMIFEDQIKARKEAKAAKAKIAMDENQNEKAISD